MKSQNRLKKPKHTNRIAHLNGDAPKLLKLDLSYGPLPDGHAYTRLFDPFTTKWDLKDNSVEEAYSAYMLHRIPKDKRGPWMDELYRVLVPGGKCVVIVPYYNSARAVQDPTAEWPPICEQSFLYFGKQFRETNKLPLDWKCDFDFGYGYGFDPETQTKADDVRAHWIKHMTNAVADLHVVLTKKAA